VNLLIVPVLGPFLGALLLALLRGRYTLEKIAGVALNAGLTGFAAWLLVHVDREGPKAMFLGGWPAPWGIAFVADRLSAAFLLGSQTVATVVLAYTAFTVERRHQEHFFYPLFHVCLLGVNWAFLTGDLFNLFVAYEVMLIGSYGAMSVGGSRAQVRETMKYLALNSIGSTMFLVGVGVVYAVTGTLNLADLSSRTAVLEGSAAGLVTVGSMFLISVFAMKAAAFPLFYWLPDSYPVVPSGILGYFGGLLTKVGVYSFLRVFVLAFRQPGSELALEILLVLSGFTMLLGVLGAMCQWEMRRLLSWHIVSQVGYMIFGIGLARDAAVADLAIAGTILHVLHNMVVKSSLFLVGGAAERIAGTQRLKHLGGLLDVSPGLAALFFVAALSLAGMPPLSGFVSKLVLLQAGLAAGRWLVVAVSVITSFLTLWSMAKIWTYGFWRAPSAAGANGSPRGMVAPIAVLVAMSVALGIGGGPAVRFARDAARELTDPSRYVVAVLGSPGAPAGAPREGGPFEARLARAADRR
jgi:multicomponent Na+:H+ antiporter subunit D